MTTKQTELRDLIARLKKATKKSERVGSDAKKQLQEHTRILKKTGLILKQRQQATPKQLKKFADILTDKSVALKIHAKKAAVYRAPQYKSEGYRVVKLQHPHKPVVIVPRTSADVQIKQKGGYVTKIQPNGVEHIEIPVPYHKLDEWLRAIKKDRRKLEKLKPVGSYWGFRFYGYRSLRTFTHIDQLEEYLRKYESVTLSINSQSAKDQMDVYRNLEIVTLTDSAKWFSERPESDLKRERPGRKIQRKLSFNRLAKPHQDQLLARRAAYARDARKKLKKDQPEKAKAQIEKSKSRVKKFRKGDK